MPWVPSGVYDEMLAALRDVRARASAVTPVGDREQGGAAVARRVHTPEVDGSNPSPAIEIPSLVAAACREYAFGDKAEEQANWEFAYERIANGMDPADVIALIRRGGIVDVGAM